MAIRNISQWQFNQSLPAHFFVEAGIGEPVEWWGAKVGHIIGAVAKGGTKPARRYIILERGADGMFQVCNLKAGIESQLAARLQLVKAMGVAETDGKIAV